MAIGSVLQNNPESPETESGPALGAPASLTTNHEPPATPLASVAEDHANDDRIDLAAFYADLNQFLEQANHEMATWRS